MKNSHCLRKKSAHKLTRSRNAPLTRVDRLDRVNRKICRSRNRAPDYADQHTLHKRVSNFIRWLLSVAIFIPIKFPILLNSQLYSITISANSRAKRTNAGVTCVLIADKIIRYRFSLPLPLGGRIICTSKSLQWSRPISPFAFRRAASFSARSTSLQSSRASTTYITASY